MDKEKLATALMGTFLGELGEHVRAINENLLALEKTADPAERAGRMQALFRSAHSLKGAARAVSVIPLETACHRLEGLLAGVRDGAIALDGSVIELLYHSADAIQDAGARLKAGRDLAGSPLESLLPRIEVLTSGDGVSMPGETGSVRGSEAPAVPNASSDSVRVSFGKMDSLMRRSGELLVASRSLEVRRAQVEELQLEVSRWMADWRGTARPGPSREGSGGEKGSSVRFRAVRQAEGERLRRMARELAGLGASLAADERTMEVAVRRIDEEARAIRMLPFVQVFQGLERAVRDLAQSSAKEVEVVMEGGEVEMDRAILEGLRDPLLQLVRNSVDHGIEPPASRRAAGKPGCGKVTVSAGLRGAFVEITVADDGRGLDLEAIRAAAGKRGMTAPKDERELARLIFLPGFSTARMITEVSGRGVGLDIARAQLENLHGNIEVSSVSGRGCRFTLEVPLTLTAIRALMITAGDRPFAIPLSGVRRLLRADPAEFRRVEGRQVLMVDGAPVTTTVLADLLGLPPDERRRASGKMPLVVLSAGERQMAVVVEELLAEREVLVKNPGPRLGHLKAILGVTILPDGATALILSPGELVRVGLTAQGTRPAVPEAGLKRRKRLLVADDSLTTRSLEKSILEGAGFEVVAVQDGTEAWESLQNRGADLVVSDVDMPRMNGFDLTREVRGSKRFRDLPVILLTGLESDTDKARGLEAGANAYLLKSGFDQKTLIETIRQLL